MVTEPKIIMSVDQQGTSTPMAYGIMVAKGIQGQSYSKLLRVLFDSGGSKYMCHRRVVPRVARIDQNARRALMNNLAGTYALLGSI